MAQTNGTRVVAAVMARSTEEALRAAKETTRGADLVELRADAIRDLDLEKLRSAGPLPVVFTCRSRREGGLFAGPETERQQILRRALELGFEYVDIELEAMNDTLRSVATTSRRILSHHAFDRFPANLPNLVDRAAASGADVVKIAGRVSSLADVLRLGEASQSVRDRGLGFAPIAMGPAGIAGRVLASRLGAELTYAAARNMPATGPGQLDLDDLLERYGFRSIDDRTEIYGIVGRPVQGSLSPVMHNDVFRSQGRNAVYVPFQEEDLSKFVPAARDLEIAGLSVTIPFKESILADLEEIDEDAKAVGAVNTVSVRDGRQGRQRKWLGHNTDTEGVVRPVSHRLEPAGKRAVILGAGGAARAAAVGLARAGAAIVVLARRLDRAQAVAELAGGEAGTLEELAGRPWDILVNATPLTSGLLPQDGELESLRPGAVVLDMNYFPEETELLGRARQRGAEAIPGLEMLVAQAVRQSEIWTGREVEPKQMEAAARGELARRAARTEDVAMERLSSTSSTSGKSKS